MGVGPTTLPDPGARGWCMFCGGLSMFMGCCATMPALPEGCLRLFLSISFSCCTFWNISCSFRACLHAASHVKQLKGQLYGQQQAVAMEEASEQVSASAFVVVSHARRCVIQS